MRRPPAPLADGETRPPAAIAAERAAILSELPRRQARTRRRHYLEERLRVLTPALLVAELQPQMPAAPASEVTNDDDEPDHPWAWRRRPRRDD